MTDLSESRKYADPWGGEDEEIAPERVSKYFKELATRPISVGLPGMYFTPGKDPQGRRRILKTEEAPKGAQTFDPMMGLITEAQALSAARGIMRTRFSKWGAGKLMQKEARAEAKAIEGLDFEDLVKRIPKGLWSRIKSFGRTARHPTSGTKYAGLHESGRRVIPRQGPPVREGSKIWVDPHGVDPAGNTIHEVGHEAGDAFLEWSEKEFLGNFRPGAPGSGAKFSTTKPGAFAKLRKEWGEVAADMRYLEGQINPAGQSQRELYRFNPDEIFARRFTEALNEGMDFREAVKFGVHEVRANLGESRRIVDETNKYLNWASQPVTPIAR